MHVHQTPRSTHDLDVAPFWRLALVVLCLGAAIYIPLLASEPYRLVDRAEPLEADIAIASPLTRLGKVLPNKMTELVGNPSALIPLSQ